MTCQTIEPVIPAICAALDETGAAALRAFPGAGKSTLAPLGILRHLERTGTAGKIIVLEPRRAAALGVASRIAELLGEEAGGRAGYAVRLERRVSAATRIEVVTEGLFVRRMQENPALPGVSVLVFDEFHERSAHTDLAFALALDLRRMGSPVRILVMSATMDAGKIARFIDTVEERGGAKKTAVFDCPGGAFPVETTYRPLSGAGSLASRWAAALVGVMRNEAAARAENGQDDILVFLPGGGEIALCGQEMRDAGLGRDFEIRALHGSLPLAEQREIIAPSGGRTKRRVILATNVAETSLTIAGVGVVVDTGYARVLRFHLASGMNRLSLEPASAASADQRRGRAGRLGPGRCVRLWAETETRPAETESEIRRADISPLALDCLIWGARRRTSLPWLETPSEAAWEAALDTLESLGAVSRAEGEEPEATALGREIARLGLDPRAGALCAAGREAGRAAPACAAAALLSARDAPGMGDDPAFAGRLAMARNGAWPGRTRLVAEDLMRRLGEHAPLRWTAADEADIGELLVRAFPDRVARKRRADAKSGAAPREEIFRFASGREARLSLPLAAAEWVCALEVDSGERVGFIRLAAAVSEATALAALKGRTVTETRVQWRGLSPRCHELVRAGKIELSSGQRPCKREELAGELAALLRREGLSPLPWEENRAAARRLLERVRFFAARRNAAGDSAAPADWSDRALAEEAADWLGPFIWRGARSGTGPVIDAPSLVRALENRLGWELKAELDRLAPDEFALPAVAGRSARSKPIDYGSGGPVVRVRLQDAFGITGAREIMSAPVTFELLSPADRPIQVTKDMDGFWAGSYLEVRREMRGRYPKHHWP